MRVLLADDHREVLSALRLLLDDEAGLQVVGEATDVRALLTATAALAPDIVLLDWELPGLPGLPSSDVIRELLARRRDLTIIALSGRTEAERVALQAGASAFVSKGDPPERLLEVLRMHQAGERF
jgi:DNA-binding NarL/FixJ family response regulator